MNQQYRSIYNKSLGAWVAVSELVRKCSKSGKVAVAISGLVLTAPLAVMAAASVVDSGDNLYTNPVTSPDWDAGAITTIGNNGVG